ncbi:cytochrome b [soil metagenome]
MIGQERYSHVARWLHWIIAALVIANILIGLFHDGMGKAFPAMPIHKAIGITVLALTLVRIGWRLTHRAPPLPAALPGWEKGAAHLTHFTFYALLLVLPLSGWVMSSANDRPLTWFWLFDIPKFGVTKGDAIVGVSGEAHEVLGLIFGALILLHIAAALRHHFILKDGILRRMLG